MRHTLDRICRDNQNTISFSIKKFFHPKIVHFVDNVEKYSTAGQVTGDNTAQALCMLYN